MLTITNLSLAQSGRTLIHRFDQQFIKGEICALVGNNGSGKTTLLRTMAGLLKPAYGRINIDELDLLAMDPKARAQILAFLPQVSPEHPYLSACHRISHGLMPLLGYDLFIDDQSYFAILEVAQRLNVRHLLKKALSRMSGGEQRLVHLAKCLINPEAKLLLLDEPSVFLDFSQQENLIDCLKDEAQKGRIIIFSSHDHYFIEKLAHRTMRIEKNLLIPNVPDLACLSTSRGN